MTIRNCNLNRGHGGLVIGSEMSGGVKNVVMTQCLMDHTDRGLRIKTRRGRGKNAVIDGLVFRNVEMRHVLTPFVINMFYFCDPDGKSDYVQSHEPLPLDDATPRLGSLTMENITATDAEYAGCWFSGLPEQPVEKVEMNNVSISFAEKCRGWPSRHDVRCRRMQQAGDLGRKREGDSLPQCQTGRLCRRTPELYQRWQL